MRRRVGKFYIRLFVSSSKPCIKTVDEVASVLRVKHLEMDNTTTRLVLLGGESRTLAAEKSLTQEKKGAICLL